MVNNATIAALAVAAVLACSSAHAQQPAPAHDLDIEIGAAAGFTPAYEGSRSIVATGAPLITLHFLRIPGMFRIGGGPDRGWSFSPSFRVVSERRARDDIRLFGLGNISAAYEAGGKIAYRWEYVRIFTTLRKGFGGHTGWTGSLGADYIYNPAPRWTFAAGPRLHFASNSYMKKYFSITPVQALASGYPIYNASAGLKGAGIETSLRYQINPKWAMIGNIEYIRLAGGAADAPLVRAGSANAFSGSLGLAYRFTTSFSAIR